MKASDFAFLRWLKHWLWILLGIWEEGDFRRVHRFVKKTVKKGWICVDAGANVGNITQIMLDRVGPTGTVIAFEPLPEIFVSLRDRFRLRSNVTCLCCALSSHNATEVPFYRRTRASDSGLSIQPSEPQSSVVSSLYVRTVTLDGFKMMRLDFLKLDVEGEEAEVIRGAAETIKRCQPIIIAECWPSKEESIFKALDEVGYMVVKRFEYDLVAMPKGLK